MTRIVALLVLSVVAVAIGEDALKAVTVLFRHGDRAPQKFYPTDPYSDPALWPVRLGQLTNLGKQQHYELGKWLRARYDHFLSRDYDPAEIRVRTSDLDRCHMSAQSNLAALYPPTQKDTWLDALPWQPIPAHSVPDVDDDMLRMSKACARYERLHKELIASEYFREIDAVNAQLYAYLNEHSGLNITTFEHIDDLFDTLFVEQYHNMTLPAWTRGVYPEKMLPLIILEQLISTYTPELARLKIGTFFGALAGQFDQEEFVPTDAMEEMTYRKFMMYSAHDTTVRNVLHALKVNDPSLVPYAACIIFELFERADGGRYVRFFYKNATAPTRLQFEDCDGDCAYARFREVLRPLAISSEEFDRECADSNLF